MTHEEFEERLKELQRQEVICSGMLLNNIKQLIIELIGEDESLGVLPIIYNSGNVLVQGYKVGRNKLRAEIKKTINGEG